MNIHLINPHLLHLLLLLSSFIAPIKASAVPKPPTTSETVASVKYAPFARRDAFTSTFDDPTAPPQPPASHDETSIASIVSSREMTPPSPPPEEWHLILEENASFLPTQAAAVVLEVFYKAVRAILAHYFGDNRLLRLLFGELELMFSPLARMQAFVTREMASVWLEYMLETVVLGAPAAYSGWMIYGPDVRVRVVLRVRQQVDVDGIGMGWRRR